MPGKSPPLRRGRRHGPSGGRSRIRIRRWFPALGTRPTRKGCPCRRRPGDPRFRAGGWWRCEPGWATCAGAGRRSYPVPREAQGGSLIQGHRSVEPALVDFAQTQVFQVIRQELRRRGSAGISGNPRIHGRQLLDTGLQPRLQGLFRQFLRYCPGAEKQGDQGCPSEQLTGGVDKSHLLILQIAMAICRQPERAFLEHAQTHRCR